MNGRPIDVRGFVLPHVSKLYAGDALGWRPGRPGMECRTRASTCTAQRRLLVAGRMAGTATNAAGGALQARTDPGRPRQRDGPRVADRRSEGDGRASRRPAVRIPPDRARQLAARAAEAYRFRGKTAGRETEARPSSRSTFVWERVSHRDGASHVPRSTESIQSCRRSSRRTRVMHAGAGDCGSPRKTLPVERDRHGFAGAPRMPSAGARSTGRSSELLELLRDTRARWSRAGASQARSGRPSDHRAVRRASRDSRGATGRHCRYDGHSDDVRTQLTTTSATGVDSR